MSCLWQCDFLVLVIDCIFVLLKSNNKAKFADDTAITGIFALPLLILCSVAMPLHVPAINLCTPPRHSHAF